MAHGASLKSMGPKISQVGLAATLVIEEERKHERCPQFSGLGGECCVKEVLEQSKQSQASASSTGTSGKRADSASYAAPGTGGESGWSKEQQNVSAALICNNDRINLLVLQHKQAHLLWHRRV